MEKGILRTETILDRILTESAQATAVRKARLPQAQIEAAARQAPPPRNAITALRGEKVALIAECKHASPSRGVLMERYDPVKIAQSYAAGGAAAISVLTDEAFFQGSLDDLRAVRAAVDLPLLRKDFVLDPYQLFEAREAGADLVLLIAAALEDGLLADLCAQTTELGMYALIEVHTEAEMERVLPINPLLLGINNRDLHTFRVDLSVSESLARMAPAGVTLVAESGISTAQDVARLARAGAHAVLVGEALVKSGDIIGATQALAGLPR